MSIRDFIKIQLAAGFTLLLFRIFVLRDMTLDMDVLKYGLLIPLLKVSLPLRVGGTRYHLSPMRPMKTICVRLRSVRSISADVLEQVRSNGVEVYFRFRVSPDSSSVYMEVKGSLTNRLRLMVSTLLQANGVAFEWARPLPKLSRYVSHPSKIHSLTKLLTDLQQFSESNEVGLAISYNRGYRISISFQATRRARVLLRSYGTRIFSRSEHVEYHRAAELLSAQEVLHHRVGSELPQGSYHIGELIADGTRAGKALLSPADLMQGGIIHGAIGQGKTTLRLHLLSMLLKEGAKVLDIDIKGDAAHCLETSSYGVVFTPGVDFGFNPFQPPNGMQPEQYFPILTTSLAGTIPDITPPQLYLLGKAVESAVKCSGDASDFFRFLFINAFTASDVLENSQLSTAMAVATRLSWMHTSLREVFWTDEQTRFDPSRSSFFDLSYVSQRVPLPVLRLLVELILMRVMVHFRHQTPSSLHRPRYVISVDEAQLLVPRKQGELTKLEEIITTMRYKGVTVLAAGVSKELMSERLQDTGFSAAFSGSELSLEPYHAMVRSRSLGVNAVEVAIREFVVTPTSVRPQTPPKMLEEFSLSNASLNELKLLSKFGRLRRLSYKDLSSLQEGRADGLAQEVIREYELYVYLMANPPKTLAERRRTEELISSLTHK